MNIKIKEKRGITLVSLVVTIIVLLILSAVSVAMLTGENGIFKTAQKAKIESQKADYRETIELSKVEEGINKKINRTKKEKLEGIYNILRNGEKFKNDVDSSKASMELIDNDELEPRIVIITKEGWKYTVTVDGIIEGEIPPIDLEKADIKIEIEPTGWTNEDVEVVSIKVQNEEYKENKIQYSYDLKTWRDYKDTEKIKITENKKIYARLANGLSISDKYATGNITNIDKKEAEISTAMNSSNVTTKGFTVNVGVKDENSGLGKIVWYYKKSDATSYTSEEVIYKDLHSVQAGETTAVTKSKTYDNLTSGTYNVYAEIYDVAGNITRANSSDKSLEITLGTVTGLTTANTTFTASPTGWTNGKVTMTASTNVSGYTIQTTKTPTVESSWKNTASQEFTENGKIYARLWDGTNAGGYSTGNVTNIDTLAPKDFTPTATSTTKSITVNASTTDADVTSTSASSGIAGYRFKLDSGSWTEYQASGTYKWDNLAQTTNHTITVEVKDNAGNTKQGTVTKGTGTVAGLTTANTTFTANPNSWTNGKVTMTASTNVSGYTIQTTKTPTVESSWKSTASQEFTENGKIYARLWDGTNAGGYSTGNVTNIDTLAPKDFTPTATSTTKSITVNASTTDADVTSTSASSGIAGYRFKLDSGSWTEYQASGTYKWDNLAQTTNHTITVEVKDNAGNTKQGTVTKGTGTVAGLTTANTTFTASPTGWTNGKVTMTASTNVSGYTIQTTKTPTVESSWKSTASQEFTENGKIYARLWDGTNAGGYSTGNVTNIDTLAPKNFTPTATSTTKSITVTANTTDAEATNTSASSGIAGYRFKLDSGSWTEYQASGTYKWDNLAQTTNHTITVEAKDNAGNTKQGTVSKGTGTVSGLTTANTTFTASPTGWTNGKVTMTASTNVSGYTIQTTKTPTVESSWKNTASQEFTENGKIYARLWDGTNAGGYSTGNVTNIDTLAPKGFTPTAKSTTKSITVTASATDAEATETSGSSGIAGYRFKLDSGSWTEYQTSGTYKWDNLTQTTNHTITVEAKDNAGNTKQGTVSKGTGTVAGLTTANTTFTASPTGWTNGKVTMTASTNVSGYTIQTTKTPTVESSWKNTASQEFTENGKIYARLWDGTNAGGYSTGNVTNIDTLAPKGFTPTATSTTKSITVTANTTDAEATNASASSGIAGYRFKLDSGSWTEYQASGTYKWDNLAQTTNHTITVEAKDNAGNTKQGTVSKGTGTVAGLTTANTTFTASPTGWTNGKVTITASTNVSGYTIQTTKTPTVESSWKNTASQEFTENGKIYARLWDGTNAGGYSTGNVTNIDTLAPKGFTPTATSTTKSITVSASTTDADVTSTSASSGIAGYRFKLDSGSWTEYQTGGTYKWDNLAQTTNHTITVEAKDNAGNTKQGTASKGTETVEKASGATYTPSGWTNGNVTVTLPTKSGFTTRYTTNGTMPTTSSTAYSNPFTVSSNSTITYIYTDGKNIGGAGTLNIENIDKDNPNQFVPKIESTTITSLKVTGNTTDDGSGIKKYYYSKDNGTNWVTNNTSSYTFENLTSGQTYKIKMKAVDNVGNETITETIEKYPGYIKEGLVLQYDAINNTGSGHSTTTNVWKDISGNGNDIKLSNFNYDSNSGWTNDALVFDGVDDYAARSNPLYTEDSRYLQNVTVEVISQSKEYANVRYGAIIDMGSTTNVNGVLDLWNAYNDGTGRNYSIYPYYDSAGTNALSYNIPISTLKHNTLNAISFGIKEGKKSFGYLNSKNILDDFTGKGEVQPKWFTNILLLGRDWRAYYGTGDLSGQEGNNYFYGYLKSVRIYNRVLSADEVSYNYKFDNQRYKIN